VAGGDIHKRYTYELDSPPKLIYPNGMPDEKYFKDCAIERQEFRKNIDGEVGNDCAECDAQYLGKQ